MRKQLLFLLVLVFNEGPTSNWSRNNHTQEQEAIREWSFAEFGGGEGMKLQWEFGIGNERSFKEGIGGMGVWRGRGSRASAFHFCCFLNFNFHHFTYMVVPPLSRIPWIIFVLYLVYTCFTVFLWLLEYTSHMRPFLNVHISFLLTERKKLEARPNRNLYKISKIIFNTFLIRGILIERVLFFMFFKQCFN